jgi:hypothetical protein
VGRYHGEPAPDDSGVHQVSDEPEAPEPEPDPALQDMTVAARVWVAAIDETRAARATNAWRLKLDAQMTAKNALEEAIRAYVKATEPEAEEAPPEGET